LKFGYSVTGLVHPQRVLANSGARPGDGLLLTKALGTGVISTAIKKGKAEPQWIEAAARSMTTLNKAAAEVITGKAGQGGAPVPASGQTYEVHGMTDITGFGLVGHARELALASDVSLHLHAGRVPLLEGAVECARAGYIPGGLKANREFAECAVEFAAAVSAELKTLLFDPQTAGGLLISVAAADAERLARDLKGNKVPVVQIGEVVPRVQPLIFVEK
jgi:selenide,water dikinase